MKTFVNKHFLSGNDTYKFLLFVVAAFGLLVLGAANKKGPIHLLPSQNQMMDSKPKQTILPQIHKPFSGDLGFDRV